MQLGEMLITRGLATQADIDAAIEREGKEGGRLGDNLIALGVVTAAQIASVVNSPPAIPTSIEESGVSDRNLLNLLVAAEATPEERADFERLYRERVDDWRPVLSGPQPATDRLMRPDFGAPPVLA